MYLGYAVVGLIAGIFIAGSDSIWLLGALAGAAIGGLLARLVELDRRVRRLESSDRRRQGSGASAWGEPVVTNTREVTPPEETSPWSRPDVEVTLEESKPTGPPIPARQASKRAVPEQAAPAPSILQTWRKKATLWITTGNVPVKVGVIISFFGVGFLLKYAIDRELLQMPLEIRLLAVGAAGIALLVIGWRLRKKERVYALSLQGGGVGILFLTIFAALQLWQLLPAPLAFLLLVLLAFLSGSLAVLQNSRMLAILGVVGGFLAPVLASTGQGNHVILFSYYLVLNCAIVGVAWYRAWRGLNLIGWVFTFLVGSLWGYQYYKPELLASTQPFLVLYFLFYQAIAILFALRQPPKRLGMVDGTLVFGTPIIVFALQAALVEGIDDALAISAAIVAVFYVLTAYWLWRSKGEPLRLLVESFTALAVVFATVAIPLAFDARWTSATWALEGAALVWVGTRQGRALPKLAGILLVFFSGISFLDYGWQRDAGLPVLNGNVLGGVLISLSALFASRRLENIDKPLFDFVQRLSSTLLFAWGALWWLGTGWMEITDRLSSNHHFHVFLLFLTLSMAACVWLGRARQWSRLRRATLVFLPMLVPIALAYLWDHDHFLSGPGWLAWPLAVAVQAFILRVMDEYEERPADVWHFATLMFLTVFLALEASWWTGLVASGAWAGAAATTVAGIAALLVWQFGNRPAWPVPVHPQTYLAGSVLLVASQVICLAYLSVALPGDPDPWPYIPVLNPFDLAMLFAMLTAARSLTALRERSDVIHASQARPFLAPYKLVLAVAFFVMTTFALVRGVHHYAGVAWNSDALFDSVIVQTALSIYWGLLGFIGMLWGARSVRRAIWLTGAGFMALVVLKLFAVDLGNTGTIERIISFIGIGALLLVVGYFAPAPPRSAND